MDSMTPNKQPTGLAATSSLLEDAEFALQNLAHQEVRLIKETEELFKSQVNYFRRIDQLRRFAPDMNSIGASTKQLMSLVDSSSAVVDDVCSKVKRMDLAKERLEDCINKIADILDLKCCREGVAEAMSSRNYEEAAMLIKRFLGIKQDVLAKTIGIIGETQKTGTGKESENDSNVDLRYMNLASEELNEARVKLLKLCQDMMSQSIKDNSQREIERFFKIFPMLNEHQDGLSRYASYLQTKIINQQVEAALESSKLNQADKLAALYESIAKLIDEHQPLVETYYGPGYLMVIIKIIQKDCDRLSRKLLEEFRNTTRLQSIAKLVRAASLQSPIIGGPNSTIQTSNPNFTSSLNLVPSKLDPREVDSILNQISSIISRSEVFLNFLVQRLKGDIESKSENEEQKQASLHELYKLVCIECELNHLVQELGGIYVMLDQFYLNESSKKAILMDQIDVETAKYPLSSMLDDIFFIIKKCINRSISTKSIEVFCATVNHCVTLLDTVFCQILEEKLKNQQYYSTAFMTKSLDLSHYLQSASELETARAQYFSALNNLDRACDYTQTLRGILNNDVKKLRPPLMAQHDGQTDKAVNCLNEFSQLTSKFSSLANSSLYQLFNTALRSKIRAEYRAIIQENPDLAASVLNDSGELQHLAKNLLTSLDKTLEDVLTPENFSKLVIITRLSLNKL